MGRGFLEVILLKSLSTDYNLLVVYLTLILSIFPFSKSLHEFISKTKKIFCQYSHKKTLVIYSLVKIHSIDLHQKRRQKNCLI